MSHFKTAVKVLASVGVTAIALSAFAGGADRKQLSQEELTELLSGNTETWSTLGAGYYNPEGDIEYVWKQKPGSGEWKITDDGVLCLKITAWYGDDFNCNWTYFRKEGDVFSLNLKTDKATRMLGFAPGKTF